MTTKSRQSQSLKAVLGLRGLILDGLIKAGERVSETLLTKEFGVSRTPARAALLQLKEEGFIEALSTGGFVVSSFSLRDVSDTIEIRGTLEGLAARQAAERGVDLDVLDAMDSCVKQMEVVVTRLSNAEDMDTYVALNDHYHELLTQAAQSPMLKRAMDRTLTLPFATPNAFVQSTKTDFAGVRTILQYSNEQHRVIAEAIRNRESARAQAIATEHARSAWQYLKLALSRQAGDQMTELNFVQGFYKKPKA